MRLLEFFYSLNARFSRAVCDGRLHDKMGGTTIHANGQRVQRRSASHFYVIFADNGQKG